MNEKEFLRRIHGRRSPDIPHPGQFPHPARTLPEDLTAEFGRRLTAVGGHVHFVPDAAAARVQLRDILDGRPVRRAILSQHAILTNLELDKLLARMGVELLETKRGGTAVATIAQADLGLTGAEYAIAASGTLVMATSPGHPRSASLLPHTHVAVIRQDQLLSDLASLAARMRRDFPQRPPSGFALITGPSRTADIELTLSIGVHGPGQLHVLLLQDGAD